MVLQYAATQVCVSSQIWPAPQSALARQPTHTPLLPSQTPVQVLLVSHFGAATHFDSTHAWFAPQSFAVLQSTQTLQPRLQTWLVALHCMSDVQPGPLTHLCWWQYAPAPQSLDAMQPTHTCRIGSQRPALQSLPVTQGGKLVWTQPEIAACAQPLAESQLSVVQSSPSSQLMAVPIPHVLLAQRPLPVQALPSSHTALLALCPQPVAPHVSSVQGFLSSQLAALAVWTQPLPGSQLSYVHATPSSQVTALPPAHVPVAQVSPLVQALPSSHVPVFGVVKQPSAEQMSSVQAFLSSHSEPAR